EARLGRRTRELLPAGQADLQITGDCQADAAQHYESPLPSETFRDEAGKQTSAEAADDRAADIGGDRRCCALRRPLVVDVGRRYREHSGRRHTLHETPE